MDKSNIKLTFKNKSTGLETQVIDYTLTTSGITTYLDMPVKQDTEAFSMIVEIKDPDIVKD